MVSFSEKDNRTSVENELKEFGKRNNRSNYSTKKIKAELGKKEILISRRCIRWIMRFEGLVSKYTVTQYKPYRRTCNEAETNSFNNRPCRNVVASDLTYMRVGTRCNYVREILGYSTEASKDSRFVSKAFSRVKGSLSNIKVFHTDRGNEFKQCYRGNS